MPGICMSGAGYYASLFRMRHGTQDFAGVYTAYTRHADIQKYDVEAGIFYQLQALLAAFSLNHL